MFLFTFFFTAAHFFLGRTASISHFLTAVTHSCCSSKLNSCSSNKKWLLGPFTINKNTGLKFPKFYVPNGTVHSFAQTRPRPPSVWLLFLQAILQSGYQRAVLGTAILSNGKGYFGPTDRNDQTGQRGPPSKLVPNIPVAPNRNVRSI